MLPAAIQIPMTVGLFVCSGWQTNCGQLSERLQLLHLCIRSDGCWQNVRIYTPSVSVPLLPDAQNFASECYSALVSLQVFNA